MTRAPKVHCQHRRKSTHGTWTNPCRRLARWHLWPRNGEGGIDVCTRCRTEISPMGMECRAFEAPGVPGTGTLQVQGRHG